MSTFEPARPRYTLPFAGKEYELLGTFGLIEVVEYAMKEHIGQVAVRVVNGMPVYELAKLISVIMNACGQKTTAKEMGELIWEHVGASGEESDKLRLHLYFFLSICLAPPGQREKKAREAGEKMGEPKVPAASPGPSTGESA